MSKVVIVTGASSGIGLEIARYPSGKGFIVYGARNTQKDFARELEKVCEASILLKNLILDFYAFLEIIRRNSY